MSRAAERILVVGSGATKSRIAMLCALTGSRTEVFDVNPAQYDGALPVPRGRMNRNSDHEQASWGGGTGGL